MIMSKIALYFFKIDQSLSALIKNGLNSSSIESIDASLKNLGNKQRSLFLNILSIVIILIPLFILLSVFLTNRSTKNLNLRYAQISQLSKEIIGKEKEIKTLAKSFSSSQISSEGDIIEQFNEMGSKFGIPDGRFITNSFDKREKGNFDIFDIAITIKKISLFELSKILEESTNQKKWIINEIEITRLNSEELLSVDLKLTVINNRL